MEEIYSHPQSSQGSAPKRHFFPKGRFRVRKPLASSSKPTSLSIEVKDDQAKRRKKILAPTPFPLNSPLPPFSTSGDERLVDFSKQRKEPGKGSVNGKGKEAKLEKAEENAVLRKEAEQADVRRGSAREEEAGPSQRRKKTAINHEFPLPPPSSRESMVSNAEDLPPNKLTSLAGGERKPPSDKQSAPTVDGSASTTRAASSVAKSLKSLAMRKVGRLDNYDSLTDSPAPLMLPGPSTIVEKKPPPPPQPFPLPKLGSYDSTPRPLKLSSSQSSLSQYVSKDFSVLSSPHIASSPSSTAGRGKRKKASRRNGEKQLRRTSSDIKRTDGCSTTTTEEAGSLTPKARKKRGVQRILSDDSGEEGGQGYVPCKEEGHAFFDALSTLGDEEPRIRSWSDLEMGIMSR